MRIRVLTPIFLCLAFVAALVPAVASDVGAQGPAVVINEFVASNQTGLVDNTGSTEDWIELRNTSGSSIDIGGWTIADSADVFIFSAGTVVSPGGFLVLIASGDVARSTGTELHLPFKLSAAGESLRLADAVGATSSPAWPPPSAYPAQTADVAFGVGSSGVLVYLPTPTPWSANGDGQTGIVESVTFSVAHGFYSGAQSVVLDTPTEATTIRFTTDGSTPSSTVGTIVSPGTAIAIASTTTLRAIAYRDGWISSPIETRTYLFVADVIDQSSTPPSGWPADNAINGADFDYGMDPAVVSGNESVVEDALQAIPTISIVTDLENLFDPTNGIYVNPQQRGVDWERPASVELIDPSGAEAGFDINAGIRLRGGFSRSSANPKHSMRLFFRNSYESHLDYPMFGDDGATTYEKIDLRTQQNYSWSWRHNDQGSFIDEVWSRDTQGAMGQPHTRSRQYHVYLNGQYWGLYMSQERVSADYAERYFGGSDDDYDVVKRGAPDVTFEASDGTAHAWTSLWSQVNDGVIDDAEFTQVASQVDLDSLADYYLLHFFSGDFDSSPSWYFEDGGLRYAASNNWYAVRNRNGTGDAGKWQFFDHDSEHSLCSTSDGHDETIDNTTPWNLTDTVDHMSPAWLHESLITHAAYRQVFADAVQRHLIDPGGALSVAAAEARLDQRVVEVSPAIDAESARWGDGPDSTDAVYGRAEWDGAVARLRSCFTSRQSIVRAQLEDDDLWPTGNPPTISPSAGPLDYETTISIDAGGQAGTIWYTTDGTDPRGSNGPASATAATWPGSLVITDDVTVTARILDGSTWTPIATAVFTLGAPPGPVSLALNEYNAVASGVYLGGGTAADTTNGADATFGRIAGNGGDWFELAVIEDHLDVRGWTIEVWNDVDGVRARDAELVLGSSGVLADLRKGSIITISESIVDDVSYFPPAGDWHINLQSNASGSGAHITVASQTAFSIDNSNTQLAIFDDSRVPVALRTGEGTVAGIGVGNTEVFKLESAPTGGLAHDSTDYVDGTSSTWGLPNRWAGGAQSQDMSGLRIDFGDVDCDARVVIIDALIVAQYAAGLRTDSTGCPLASQATEANAEAGDVNGDGNTNVVDALLIARCTAGLPTIFCPD